MLLGIYMWPLWYDAASWFLSPACLLAALIGWVLSGRRWVAYVYWVLVVHVMGPYAMQAGIDGWKALLPEAPHPSL